MLARLRCFGCEPRWLQSGTCAARCLHRAYRTLSKSPTMATRKTLTGTDGSRLYLHFWFSGQQTIWQVAIAGGEIVPFPVPLPNPPLRCLSGRVLLARRLRRKRPTESVGFAGSGRVGASHRKWRDPQAQHGLQMGGPWSTARQPTTSLWLRGMERTCGSSALRKAVTAGRWDFAWSPDGAIIRFNSGGRLWEMSSDGSGLHQVLPGWRPSSSSVAAVGLPMESSSCSSYRSNPTREPNLGFG